MDKDQKKRRYPHTGKYGHRSLEKEVPTERKIWTKISRKGGTHTQENIDTDQ